MSTDHARAEAERLLSAAFEIPRTPRSPEYKAGALAVLTWLAGAMLKMPRCPHPAGTAQADAWLSGIAEGHAIWNNEQARRAVKGGAA
jgi:hypothetical protein